MCILQNFLGFSLEKRTLELSDVANQYLTEALATRDVPRLFQPQWKIPSLFFESLARCLMAKPLFTPQNPLILETTKSVIYFFTVFCW